MSWCTWFCVSVWNSWKRDLKGKRSQAEFFFLKHCQQTQKADLGRMNISSRRKLSSIPQWRKIRLYKMLSPSSELAHCTRHLYIPDRERHSTSDFFITQFQPVRGHCSSGAVLCIQTKRIAFCQMESVEPEIGYTDPTGTQWSLGMRSAASLSRLCTWFGSCKRTPRCSWGTILPLQPEKGQDSGFWSRWSEFGLDLRTQTWKSHLRPWGTKSLFQLWKSLPTVRRPPGSVIHTLYITTRKYTQQKTMVLPIKTLGTCSTESPQALPGSTTPASPRISLFLVAENLVDGSSWNIRNQMAPVISRAAKTRRALIFMSENQNQKPISWISASGFASAGKFTKASECRQASTNSLATSFYQKICPRVGKFGKAQTLEIGPIARVTIKKITTFLPFLSLKNELVCDKLIKKSSFCINLKNATIYCCTFQELGAKFCLFVQIAMNHLKHHGTSVLSSGLQERAGKFACETLKAHW